MGPGAQNIVVTENTYTKDTTSKTTIFGILLPSQNVTISRNTAYYGCIFVAGGEGVYIEDNIFEYDPTRTTDDTAPIAIRPDTWILTQGLPNTGKICGNTIKNMAGALLGEDTNAILLRGTNFDISRNRLEYPRAGVTYVINVDSLDSDYVIGNDNVAVLGASSVIDVLRPVKIFTGSNQNGGTVFCSLVDIVSNTQNSYKYVGFGDLLNVVGLTTAGTVTLGARASNYILVNDLCFIQMTIAWSSLTGTGDLAITGLPFPADNREFAAYKYMFNVSADGLTYSGTQLVAYVLSNESQIRIGQFSSGGALTAVPVDAAATLNLSGFYPYKFQ
jgi:hypothetical protein